MEDFIPWLHYPSLTADRLEVVAEIIRTARKNAASFHNPDLGDDGWVLGCRAYRWTCYAIEQAVPSNPWLEVLNDFEGKNLRFIFAIGGLPIRIYKGVPDDPPSKSLAVAYSELQKWQMALDFGTQDNQEAKNILRIAIETGPTGEASTITLVELEEDEQRAVKPLRKYQIPERVAVQVKVIATYAKAIELPPAVVEAIEQDDSNNEKEAGNAAG